MLSQARAGILCTAPNPALDLDRPVALLMLSVLPFIPDDEEPYAVVRHFMDALPSGSYLALSHVTADFDNGELARAHVAYQARSRAEIERFADGLDIVAPGVELIDRWRPAPSDTVEDERPATPVPAYGLVARKP